MKEVKLLIWDLDGLILETETLVIKYATAVLQSHGYDLTSDAIACSIGKRPLDAWQAVVDMLNITSITAEQLLAESEALLTPHWHEATVLPGVYRLLTHFKTHNIPQALATSTPRATLLVKLSNKPDILHMFGDLTVCGDEVERGKPNPDCYLHIAKRAGVHPSHCLVLEDSPSGCQAAIDAGMICIIVPSMTDKSCYPTPTTNDEGCVAAMIPSLLDFNPLHFPGLPLFQDTICSTIPLQPEWRIKGTVVKGFGRGSKQLGIPTANLDAASLSRALAEAVTGIYCGWCNIRGPGVEEHSDKVFKMVMSVGFNPVFKQKQRSMEPWILHDFGGRDFYGAEIRLIVVGYLRPELDFEGVENLIKQIHNDADVAREVLERGEYGRFRNDPFLLGLGGGRGGGVGVGVGG